MNEGYMQYVVYAVAAIIIVLAVKVFITPIKLSLKLLLNTALGLVMLALFNLGGAYINVTLGLNLFNGLVMGIFGPLGLLLLLLLRWLTI